MEFEERNPKPAEPKNGLPVMVLFILIGIICLLLYAGWHLMSDDASKVTDLKETSEVIQENAQPNESVDAESTTEENISSGPESISVPEVKSSLKASKNIEDQEAKTELKSETEKTKVATPKINGESYTHTVGNSETFYGIGNKFNISTNTLKKLNPNVDPNGIKVGVTKIQVPIQGRHTVGPGDILKVVATKYGISVEQLMVANGKSKNFAKRGEVLIIPNKTKQ